MKAISKWAVVALMMAVVIGVSGCPSGANPNGLNSLVVHNQHTENIEALSVSKTGPVPNGAEKAGVNLLAQPIPPGESFTVANLADGEYQISVTYLYETINFQGQTILSSNSRSFEQVFEGGLKYDLYFDYDVTDKAVPSSEGCCLSKWLCN